MSKDYYDPNFHGTDSYTRYKLFSDNTIYLYTDSIADHAEKFGAHWLLDVIGSHVPTLIRKLPRGERFFYVLTLDVDAEKHSAVFEARIDTGCPAVVTQRIQFTDLPHSVKLYIAEGGPEGLPVLMFPSDY